MDTITQGILGAAAAQALMTKRLPRNAGMIGAIAGMIPDLDIFIRSSTDPTLAWLYHRNFTHSLFFIPIGGLIAALPFLFLNRLRDHKKAVILAAIIGYATHGPLDLFTSYGTQLLWPFTNHRFALDWIGIIDPIYTIILAVGVYLTARTKRMRPVLVALLISSLYMCFGGWQHYRGMEAQRELAAIRGHRLAHSRVMPAPGLLLYWRSVYITEGRLYTDGIHLPWIGSAQILDGGSADATTVEDLPATAQANVETRRQFEIFNWFADGLIAGVGDNPPAVGDMRITTSVEGLVPLWGLQFDPSTGKANRWDPPISIRRDYQGLIRSLILGDPRYSPLSLRRERETR